uniref:Polymerase nucleotidyl transferase domain-containing protein n=2 Tax=Oryza meridionalis TaxID=40149 RepID=A0A0E0E7A9_9ORYZ
MQAAEAAADEVVIRVQATEEAERTQQGIIGYLKLLFGTALGCEVFAFGSVPLKTYLPDGDIDITILGNTALDSTFISEEQEDGADVALTEELFGMLISVLFLQQAIKGIREEFKVPRDADYSSPIYQFKWLYVNGLLGVIFSIGYTALRSRRARSWLYGQGWLRGFIADYGVPLLVNVWTTFSYTLPKDVPSGVPRRLFKSTSLGVKFTATLDRSKVPPAYIFAVILPALMVSLCAEIDRIKKENDNMQIELRELTSTNTIVTSRHQMPTCNGLQVNRLICSLSEVLSN